MCGCHEIRVRPNTVTQPNLFSSAAVVVHQESVCVTFGSGLSSACVVDVGDQKTSVCCVEDGVSHRSSRSEKHTMRFIIRYVKCFIFSEDNASCVKLKPKQHTSLQQDTLTHKC